MVICTNNSSASSIDDVFYEAEIFILNTCYDIDKIIVTEQEESESIDKDKILVSYISIKGKIDKLYNDSIQSIKKIAHDNNSTFERLLADPKSENLQSSISSYISNHDYYDDIYIEFKRNVSTEVKCVNDYMEEYKSSNKKNVVRKIQNFLSQSFDQNKFVKEFTKEIYDLRNSVLYKLDRMNEHIDYKSYTNMIKNLANMYIAGTRCTVYNARTILEILYRTKGE